MSRRRPRRRVKASRHSHGSREADAPAQPFESPIAPPRTAPLLAQPRPSERAPRVVVREAESVERLAYTRAQAAQALGISRSTLRRVLPYVETIEMPWGTSLIPVDELERLLGERRRAPRERAKPASVGRPRTLPGDVVQRIRVAFAAGESLHQIATALNEDGTPTAHGGARWWPSTVRSVLRRSAE